MAEIENMKRKSDTLTLQSPQSSKYVKMEDVLEGPKSGLGPNTHSIITTATACDATRGNITLIHVQTTGKHRGTRMQWTFPRSYLTGRTRSTSPQSPDTSSNDAELNTASLNGTFSPEAISLFYQAITTETSISSYNHSLLEYCQVYALAEYFRISNIFQDGETLLLRRVMGEETPLDGIRAASSFASVFRWRALVERCRFLLAKRARRLETDIKLMNCGGLNMLATKLDEVYDFLAKSGFVASPTEVMRERK
jgi:hypothetical protein